MGERIAYPSVETILQVGGKKAPSGLPVEVVNRFAFLDHINGKPPLVVQWWFTDEVGTYRQLTSEEKDKLVGFMSRLAPVDNKGFGEIMEDFFRANARLEHLKSIDMSVFSGEIRKSFAEGLRDDNVDVAGEAIGRQEIETMRVLVFQIMRELPEKHRQVLDLHFRKGLTHKEIGEQIGLSRSGVGLRVRNALQAAREVLKNASFQKLSPELDSF